MNYISQNYATTRNRSCGRTRNESSQSEPCPIIRGKGWNHISWQCTPVDAAARHL